MYEVHQSPSPPKHAVYAKIKDLKEASSNQRSAAKREHLCVRAQGGLQYTASPVMLSKYSHKSIREEEPDTWEAELGCCEVTSTYQRKPPGASS